MKKKIFNKLLTILGLSISLVSCNNDTTSNTSSNDKTTSYETTTTSTTPDNNTSSTSIQVEDPNYSGEGTKESPYLIDNKTQLKNFRDNYNLGTYNSTFIYVKLTNDISLNNETWTSIGTEMYKFYGNFNGNYHTISNINLTYTEESTMSYLGFFGISKSSNFENITLSNITISHNYMTEEFDFRCGGFIGYSINSNFTNISIEFDNYELTFNQDVFGRIYAGGLAGYLSVESDENNSYFTNINAISVKGNITSNISIESTSITDFVGGICGYTYTESFTNALSITNCLLNVNLVGKNYIGGVAGNISSYVSIQDCIVISDTEIKGSGTHGNDNAVVGGIVGSGYYETIIKNCILNVNKLTAAESDYTTKSQVGEIVGNAYESDYEAYETLGTQVVNSYINENVTIEGDETNFDAIEYDSSTYFQNIANTTLKFDSTIWDLNRADGIIYLKNTLENYYSDVNVIYDTNGGILLDSEQTLLGSYSSNQFDSDFVTKTLDLQLSKQDCSFYGFTYDELGLFKYVWYAPLTSDTTLYGGFASIQNLKGTYDVTYTYYSQSGSSGKWLIDETNFYWLMADNCLSKYKYKFDGEHLYLVDYVGNTVLESILGGYTDSVFVYDESTNSISGYDINDRECTFSGIKSTTEINIPNYSSQGVVGNWYNQNGYKLVFLTDGNYYGYRKSYSGDNLILSVGGYTYDSSTFSIEISYADTIMSKTSAKYDSTNDIVYNNTGVILAREEIKTIYKTSDNSLTITVTDSYSYTILDGNITTYEGTLADGETITVNSKKYSISGTTLTLVEEQPQTTNYSFIGTWTGTVGSNSNVKLILNQDNTATYGETAGTWTYNEPNLVVELNDNSKLTLIYSSENTTLTGYWSDEYEEYNLDATFSVFDSSSNQNSENTFIGSWNGSVNSNTVTLILKDDNSGSYNGTDITWTYNSETKLLTVTISASMYLELTYNDQNQTLTGTYYDTDEYYEFEATFDTYVKEENNSNNENVFIGTWKGTILSNSNAQIIINEDNTAIYGNYSMTYTISDLTITIKDTNEEYIFVLTYDSTTQKLSGTMTYDYTDYNVEFTKVS